MRSLRVAPQELYCSAKPYHGWYYSLDRVSINVEFWSAVVLDHAAVPQSLFLPLFVCARTAGWSAHILEQHRTGG
jgi:citrate synthase